MIHQQYTIRLSSQLFFALLLTNFNICTIASSMLVDHEGTVYWERCYGKKTTFCMCLLNFFGLLNVWKKGNFLRIYRSKNVDIFVVHYFFWPESCEEKINIVLELWYQFNTYDLKDCKGPLGIGQWTNLFLWLKYTSMTLFIIDLGIVNHKCPCLTKENFMLKI